MSAPRFPGTTIEVGGVRLVVPRLSIRQFQVLKDQIKRIQEKRKELDIDEQIADILDVLEASVGRNHPELSRDQLADLLDFESIGPFLAAAFQGPSVGDTPKGEAESPAST